ncbi:isocitrate lyase/phosphoenolpyruvate mutase family protein [Mucilaginibacter sp. L3T2-6]|uniref:isocitrate lyase/PEP mutase family protein n=1 Tax=Mucilaginibacter sp. L3T2-6 TaxID=3062491 RepID=UPI002675C811|nr:isocitrate lyase/phosphoenolpyruvate mutase family protein [Mucilaginibacter sp. L3T2-6]MDO3643872.1 isocitrate lyase/phosphoenolpyruvate mutase family protein [Mucilaginibacter sp. L3T2-6]MDV6216405.1 isocitrate lyase/phosphoenolpyruvate mutase family protein [Mucilaginibacter sp. L3T2-6]
MSKFKTFKQLHQQADPLLLGNIWDVNSAKLFEAAGYKAIGVSSHAIANAWGYEDGEKLPFDILLQVAKRVAEVAAIPFTVDMEGGYSRSIEGITKNINLLHDAGVAGINLEDTIVTGSSRCLQLTEEYQKMLSSIADYVSRNNLRIFLNVRTDGFLLGLPNALEETLTRINAYKNTGIDGIFVPCITDSNDIRSVVNATKLPINVMCMPGLPGFNELTTLGVKRISMGPFLFSKVYNHAAALAKSVISNRNFSAIL